MINRLLLIALATATLNGCAGFVGCGVHASGVDRPEVDMGPTICSIGARHRLDEKWMIEARHDSDPFTTEHGIGYNLIQIQREWDADDWRNVTKWLGE